MTEDELRECEARISNGRRLLEKIRKLAQAQKEIESGQIQKLHLAVGEEREAYPVQVTKKGERAATGVCYSSDFPEFAVDVRRAVLGIIARLRAELEAELEKL